jgi:ceramide glucosyltransferase
MMHVLLVLSLLGLTTSTVYTLLVASGAFRFAKRRRTAESGQFAPPVSLLKPLHGSEQELELRLESFFRQEYPQFEILFCARSHQDPALSLAMRVAARYPHVATKFLSCGEAPYANAKVWSLEQMERSAEHQILVVSDSDVSVTSDYLRAVIAPFADDQVGLVTCLYRGVALSSHTAKSRSLWSSLEAVGMSVEMTSGVLVAEMLDGMSFALGPTMAVRRDCLNRAGGFAAIGEYHGDDFMLGKLVAADGCRVVLSTHSIAHHILNSSFVSSARHQIRWMRGTRFYRPKGHLGTVLTFGMPYGLLAAGILSMQRPWLAALLLAGSWATRVALAALVGRLVVREPDLWRNALLYPLRDLLGFFLWGASYLGNQVVWRGEIYELLRGGLMRNNGIPMYPAVAPLGLTSQASTDSIQR